MDNLPPDLLDRIRALMPMRTLGMLARPMNDAEARTVAERQANYLLRLLHITKPSVEIELIAELPDVEVEVEPDLPLSGSSDWTGERWLIQINADDSLWRCRATLAHEIKHILDDPFREALYPDWPRDGSTPPLRAEQLSDYFAGCVLVPKAWLRQAWNAGYRSPTTLASLFDVSESLINVRLRQVGLQQKRRSLSPWRGYTRRAYRRSAAAIQNAALRLQDVPAPNREAVRERYPV